ncbi:type II secretion system protein N [Pseudomonas viridiflava]|uniref:Type II secretion system protein N n=1 Tax=Pseudomonas viridiflava TaxID=33069 RepID=A0ABU7N5Q5_PSEVI|nr:type II secretion system protein N [Pseudomonas viridiflava]MBI6576676.1 general secretion pathway protein GspC [Pseudomonas viridiflava]MBI6609046.1 general secretion pathway protein GspC [Pseudomonas viridiflava]MBI6636951.1 general secretion pathway protein GspC [Pseudomonas viridiflava]MBI6870291.1 general secretion pathway protein GspC [Pseudomonas viridiflava]MEE3935346.1 type II secretion system protein N [Pseudomonas viridiflava]
MAVTFGVSAPRLLQSAALLAALAGVVVWSSLLMTSAQSSAPLPTSVTQEGGSASPASQWFANQPSQVQISVSGVMAGARGAVAVIRLNDGPARSVMAGERLARDVRLVSIEADGVVIERGSEQTRIKVSTLSEISGLPDLIRR